MKNKKLMVLMLAAIMTILLLTNTYATELVSDIDKLTYYVFAVGVVITLLAAISIIITFIASVVNSKINDKSRFVIYICIIGLIIGLTIILLSSNIAELIRDDSGII